ncbi:hypothetical protein M2271_001386 [Streptomyces sp. LBL]|nr:hypothetical protein [Streptomyces sp. LBL]
MKTEDQTVAAGHSVDPARWQEAFEGLMARIAGRFTRVEPRRRVGRLVLGLLSDLPRKNCWTIAEWAGERTPDGMQHLLGRARWDAGQVRDDVRAYVVEHLHDDQAVLAVDETSRTDGGASVIHSPTASREVAPARTAHTVSASMTTRACRTPGSSRWPGAFRAVTANHTRAAATIAPMMTSTYRKAAWENTVPRRTIVTSRHTQQPRQSEQPAVHRLDASALS